jgi:hypothetical protein
MARSSRAACCSALITLWLLATIVFVIANVLPNDVGRTILGPFAPQESVDALNQKLGTDRPIIVQYVDAMISVATFDYGDSYVTGQARPADAGRRDRPVGEAGRARPAANHPGRHRGRPVRRETARSTGRPRDRAVGP